MGEALRYGKIPFLAAKRQYAAGELLLPLGDVATTEANPRRIQVTADRFILPPRLIYHSCNPNAYIDWGSMTLRARGHIAQGGLVTYHYGSSEFDYTVGAFQCQCDSLSCVGYFKGFLYLNLAQQAELYERASPYIQGIYNRQWNDYRFAE